MNKWISVADELPDFNIDVLVFYDRSIYIADRWERMSEVGGYEWLNSSGINVYPSHWMKLPDAPDVMGKSTKKRIETQEGDDGY